MKKKLFLILFLQIIVNFLPNFSPLFAQNPKRFPSVTRNIEDFYRYVSEKIKHNQYYINEWTYNQFKQTWWDKTANYGSESYYYSFLGENEPVIRLASMQILKDTFANTKENNKNEKQPYYYEFLYNQEGHLSLVVERQKDEKNLPYREMKVFFDKRKCINIFLDKDIIPHNNTGYNEKIGVLQKLGEEYYQKFQTQVQEITH